MRKERAVGVVPQAPTVYEVLEEIVITVQAQLVDSRLPFCAFNGGADVFVDVGNKSLGLEALMKHLGFRPHQVLLSPMPGLQAPYQIAPRLRYSVILQNHAYSKEVRVA